MRIMAIDYGDVRTGLAVSDPSGLICGDAWTVEERSAPALVTRISGEVRDRGVAKLVLGFPRNMDGSLGPRAEKSSELAALLRDETGLEVVLWDERRTTVDAHRILFEAGHNGKKRKKVVDAVAASLILEGYLGSIK